MEICINTEHVLDIEIDGNQLSIDGVDSDDLIQQIRECWSQEDDYWHIVAVLNIALLLRGPEYNAKTANDILDMMVAIANWMLTDCEGIDPGTRGWLGVISSCRCFSSAAE
jgi:hypothetical protein